MKKFSDIAFKLLLLIITSFAGWLVFLVSMNLMIKLGLFPEEVMDQGFGYSIVEKSVIVWMISVVLAFGSLFTDGKLRIAFLSLPVILPSLFSLIYVLTL